jgi:hypothetical protein
MKDLFDQIKIFKSNPHYRLGDLIFKKGDRYSYDSKIILNNPEYKGSFLRLYLESKSYLKKIDMNAFKKCINSLKNRVNVNENTLYINMRLGDCVMHSYGKNIGLFLYFPDKLYIKIFEKLNKNKDIKKIEIVSALNFGDNDFKKIWQFNEEAVEENRIRFNDIIHTIKSRFNLPISIPYSKKSQVDHIDEDFLTLSLAKHSITDSGGFGDVINIARSIF